MIRRRFERDPARLRAAIEVTADQTLQRAAAVVAVALVMAVFGGGAILPLALTLCLLDDLFLLWVRRRMRRDGLTLQLAAAATLSNVVGVIAFCAMLLYTQWVSDDPVAGISVMIVLTVAMIDMASPRSQINPFSWHLTLPIWLSLVVSVAIVLHGVSDGFAGLGLAIGILIFAAVYIVTIFAQNDRNVTELERETERALDESKAKTRFLADMSHEIRTPLHAVHGTAQLLEHETDPEAIRRLSRILIDAAGSLKSIVDDVIDMSRAEAGKIDIRAEPHDPVALARSVLDLFQANADRRGIRLALAVGDGLPPRALLDRVRVGQVLSNLVSNALKFTDHGEVVLTVGRTGAHADGESLVFTVRDTGSGIAHDMQGAVFEAYETLGGQDGVKRAMTGAGLGLAIGRKLARLMGGDITLVSAPGKGSAFTLHVPLAVCAVGAAPEAIPAEANGATLEGRSVLVIDDVDINRIVVRAMLERFGAVVDEAANGTEGLQKLAGARYDIVLLDHMMPGMSGPEMLSRLRALPGPESRTIVLGLSAGTLNEDRDAFMARGLDGFLTKPVAMDELIHTVASARRARPA